MANYDLIYPGQTIDQLLTTAYYLKNAGYIFLGSASSYSGTPSQRAWLIAPSGFTGFGFSEAIPIGSMGICLYNGASWSGVTINVVTVDETMTAGSDNPISSGAVYDVLSTITQGISAQLDSLELADATDPSDILDVLTVALKMTKGGFDVVVSSLNILSATASKAGLMSAADKIKLDGFVNNIRSLVFADTTPSSYLGTQIVESLKWTVDNVQEVITTLTLLAASSEKAGLMSAADKAYVDGLPTTLGTMTSALQDMLASILSIVFDDTTPSSDKANKIEETMKWTSGGIQRAITTLTILSATASKAGLMSAADKAYVDGLPATLTSLSNSINSIETDLLNYYTKEQTYSKTEVDTLLDGKQNVIDDLAAIRSGSTAGATAVQPADMNSAISSVRASIGYYECSTAAGTVAKTVSAPGYSLTNGGCIRIKMANANTADNVTLNINSTGAKALYYDCAQASSANTWEAGEVLEVYYDGTQYQCVSGGGGKFATGQKVKDVSISDEINNDGSLLTGKAVFPISQDIEEAESTSEPVTVTYVQGSTYNNTGADTPDNNCIRTDYLDVSDVSSITLSSVLPSGYTLSVKPTWYNSSKALLSTPSWTGQSDSDITVAVPNGAYYLRLVVSGNNNGTQITLTPASATAYSFVLRPFESDSRWHGLLKKCEILNEIDNTPVENSQKLVRSGGIYDILFSSVATTVDGTTLTSCGGTIRPSDLKWIANNAYYGALIDVQDKTGEFVKIIKNANGNSISYTFVRAGFSANQSAQFASGYSNVVVSSADVETIVPDDAVYLYVYMRSENTIFTPSKVVFGVDNFNDRIIAVEGVAADVEELDKAVFSEDNEETILGTSIPSCGGTISNQNKWTANRDYFGGLISCAEYQGKSCFIKKGTLNVVYTFLTSGFSAGNTPQYATGYSSTVGSSTDVDIEVPSDAVYLYIYLQSTSANNYRPQYVKLGYEGLVKKVGEIEQKLDNMTGGNSFRIACYNIGHFSHGANQNSSITGTDYVEKLAAYRQLVYGKLGTDVIGLCEYSAIFGNDGTTNQSAEEVLFNRFEFDYIGEQIRYSCNALYSNMYVENMSKKIYECNQNAVITHTTAIEATDYYYIEADLWFHGSLIKLIMTHLAFDNNNPQIVANQISELITKFASEPKVIMMGDWNVASFSQFDPFVAAGYTLGNKGQATYSDTNTTKALDNIIVKGVEISNVGVVQTSGLSDHLPIYATITLS